MTGDATKVFILDGDVIRTGLNKDLGFSAEARTENIRRISEVSKLFNMAGVIVFVAFISPYQKDRNFAKTLHKEAGLKFFECHISASLEVCEGRDVKGLYKKARAGVIPVFTGISDPYDVPEACELEVSTGTQTLQESTEFVLKHMHEQGVIAKKSAPRVFQSLVREPTAAEAEEYASLPFIDIDVHLAQYLQTIGDGWAFPLKRFMNETELLESMHMKTVTDEHGERHLLSVPITQHVTEEQKQALAGHKKVAIKCTTVSLHVLAVINEPVFFENRKEEICARTFGTLSAKHPKAETIFAQGNWLISGKSMDFVKRIHFDDGMDKYRFTPHEISEQIKARGADAVYAF
jgi:3'-phosphoadenosine 5'-phosphosulfate synthase